MQPRLSLTTLALCAAAAYASPVADPDISPFPNLVPTSAVDLATDDTAGVRTVSPLRMPAHPITLAKRDTTSAFPDLVPTSTVDLATDSTFTTQNVSPARVPTSVATFAGESTTAGCVVVISNSAYETTCTNSSTSAVTAAIAEATTLATSSFPDLVPTSLVNLATDTGGVRTLSPAREATSTVTLGSATAAASATTLKDSSDVKKESSAASSLALPGRPLWSLLSVCLRGFRQ